jgi:hypothetical protein
MAYNPGILGGNTASLLRVLDLIVRELENTPVQENCNLISTNVVLHSAACDPSEIFTGRAVASSSCVWSGGCTSVCEGRGGVGGLCTWVIMCACLHWCTTHSHLQPV